LSIGHFFKKETVFFFFFFSVSGVGVLFGAISKLLQSPIMAADERFDDQFFMTWLLPPIIFAAGYNM